MRRKIIFYLGVVVSLLFVVLILRNIDFKELKESFSKIKCIYLFPALAVYAFGFCLRILRWKCLFRHERSVKTNSVFSALMIGFMVNHIFPARIGEVVRAYVLSKKEGLSKTLSFGTVVMGRLFDIMTLLIFLSVIFLIFPLPPLFKNINYIGAAGFISVLIFIIFLIYNKNKAFNFMNRCLFFLPAAIAGKLLRGVEELIGGFDVIKNKRNLLLVLLCSVCIWLVEAGVCFILTKSFGISVPFYGVILVIILTSLRVLIPASPGHIGTFEGFCIVGLLFFGVNKEAGLGFSIVYHAFISIPVILIGFGLLLKENFSWAEVTRVKE